MLDDKSCSEMIEELVPEIKVVAGAADTNPWGCIHGGAMMTHLDTAGGMAAIRRSGHPVVTRVFNCEFLEPALVGDLLSVFAEVVKVGHTSLTCRAVMVADRFNPRTCQRTVHKVATADIVYVAIDTQGQAVPVEG